MPDAEEKDGKDDAEKTEKEETFDSLFRVVEEPVESVAAMKRRTDPRLVAIEARSSSPADSPHVAALRGKLLREILSGSRSRAVLRLYARLLRAQGRSP